MIVWRKEYNLGIELIDIQHKKLVDIINELKAGLDNSKDGEILKEVLPRIVEYSKVHFNDEEKLMEAQGYPLLNEHKAQHKILINQVIELLENLKSGKTRVGTDLFDFLKVWLMKHVLDHDKEFGYFMADNKK